MVLTILQFLLKNWKIILVLVLSGTLVAKFDYDRRSMLKSHQASIESYEKQLEGIRAIHTEELQLRENALAEYEARLQGLESAYQQNLKKLEILKQQRISTYIEQYEEAPDELAKEIERLFNLVFVE